MAYTLLGALLNKGEPIDKWTMTDDRNCSYIYMPPPVAKSKGIAYFYITMSL